jgi:predicted tellurium resistance membrane protein TerC
VIFSFILPLSIIIASVYWTIRVSYSKRYIPTLTLLLLAILVFFRTFLLAEVDVIEKGFGPAIQSIYYSGFLGLGVLVNVIVVNCIKKNKETDIKL